jgi:hypothetical protein
MLFGLLVDFSKLIERMFCGIAKSERQGFATCSDFAKREARLAPRIKTICKT